MTDSHYMAGFYTSVSEDLIPEHLVCALDRSGFNVWETQRRDMYGEPSKNEYSFRVPNDGAPFTVTYTTDGNRKPKKSAVDISSLSHSVLPYWSDDAAEYRRRIEPIFELVCRLAIALEAEYVALIDARDQGTEVAPSGRPIAENVAEPPRFGVYSPKVLDGFGGTERLFETQPWYTATLTSDHTVVIETDQPWAEGEWRPPTDAPYIESAQFDE